MKYIFLQVHSTEPNFENVLMVKIFTRICSHRRKIQTLLKLVFSNTLQLISEQKYSY